MKTLEKMINEMSVIKAGLVNHRKPYRTIKRNHYSSDWNYENSCFLEP